MQVRPLLSLVQRTEPERSACPYSNVTDSTPISESPVQVNPAFPAEMYIPNPQSSSHDDGLGGGVQDLRIMSQRTADGLRSQTMFFEGVRKNTLDMRRTAAVANLQRVARLPAAA